MLTALVLIAAGAALYGVPLFEDLFVGAAAGLMAARLLFVVLEHGGTPLADIHRRRLDALWLVVGAGIGGIVYMLLR